GPGLPAWAKARRARRASARGPRRPRSWDRSWKNLLCGVGIEPGRRGGFQPVGKIGEVRDQVGRPIDAAMTQPAGKEAVAAVFGGDLRNEGLVGSCGCGAECESDFGQAKLEQAIAAPRLAVIIPLGRCPREDFDLPVIEAEAAINGRDLWL